jgi:DNA-binding response OmpR family regulator
VKGLVLSLQGRTVFLNKEEVQLSSKEFDLLYLLLLNPGVVLNKVFILENVFKYNTPVETRTIDTHIKNLRSDLKEWGRKYIKTVFGVGFKFDPYAK